MKKKIRLNPPKLTAAHMFRIGDRVRVVSTNLKHFGRTGIIEGVHAYTIATKVDKFIFDYYEYELELVSRPSKSFR